MRVLSSIRIRVAVAAAAAGLVAACVTPVREEGEDCRPDNMTVVAARGECLVIRIFGAASDNRTLVVFVHGDDNIPEGGRPRDYLAGLARRVSGDGVTAAVLLRPGHHDSRGRASTTRGGRYRIDWFHHDTGVISDAIAQLKAHHGAKRVVLVGHSIGAAISIAILGRTPIPVDSAVLIACLCNWSPGAPITVSTDVEVVVLTGANDTVTVPGIGRNFAAALANRGAPATFVEVANAGHELVDHPQVREAINRLARRN